MKEAFTMVAVEGRKQLRVVRGEMCRLTIGAVGQTSFESRSVWVLDNPYFPGEISLDGSTYAFLLGWEKSGAASISSTLWDEEVVRACRVLRRAGVNHFLAADWRMYRGLAIYVQTTRKPVRPSGGLY
ncbi:MAG: hypothetical protein A2172_03505 [Candidatus Woykebacteria bacterium RBG_13_40_15]|uniref:Uncharacterized protein n=1 Tax=Candidatus Woykebacteria bacterium RBG_13_40_15 TaxID=1802593 RepID=A0A1G1W5K7_9BACT|nr:MAG: hypothetical protein A2172_03505 [Candidatus Woykebacteria bacterium RBG_13_40_15]